MCTETFNSTNNAMSYVYGDFFVILGKELEASTVHATYPK